jgi:hypothetical protein
MKIYKYQLVPAIEQKVEIPQESEILTIQYQNGFPTIWAMTYNNQPIVTRIAKLLMTGEDVEPSAMENYDYVGTLQSPTNHLVLHYFISRESQ